VSIHTLKVRCTKRVIARVSHWSPPEMEITNRGGVSSDLKSRILDPESMVNMLLWFNSYVLQIDQDTTEGDTRILECSVLDVTGPTVNEWDFFTNTKAS
jgi:hypothetical protein